MKCRALQIYCTCSSTVFSPNFPVELFRDLQLFKITTMPGTNAKVARTYIFMQWPHFNLQTCSFEELCIHENAPTCNIHAQRSYKRRYGKLKCTSWNQWKGGNSKIYSLRDHLGFFYPEKFTGTKTYFLRRFDIFYIYHSVVSRNTPHTIF